MLAGYRVFVFHFLLPPFWSLKQDPFSFQYNVQNQAEVTKQRKPRNRTDNNQSRRGCRYVSGTCRDCCIRRRFHTGVLLADPPVAVFADKGGQTVLTVRADDLAEIDRLSVGIGDNKLAVRIDLRLAIPIPSLPSFPRFTVSAACRFVRSCRSVPVCPASPGSPLSPLSPFSPCCPSLPVSPFSPVAFTPRDTMSVRRHRRHTRGYLPRFLSRGVMPSFPSCRGRLYLPYLLVALVALVAFFALQLRQGNQIIPDGIIAVLPLYESVIPASSICFPSAPSFPVSSASETRSR